MQADAALALLNAGDAPGAERLCRAALAGAPKAPVLWFVLGVVMSRQSDLPQALDAFGKVVDLDPSNAAARTRMADVLARLGRSDEAEYQLNIAIALSPPNGQALHLLAAIKAAKGELEAAEAFFVQALAAGFRSVDALRFLAERRINQFRPVDALAFLDELLELNPGDPFYSRLKAFCLHNLGENREARDTLWTAMTTHPEAEEGLASSFLFMHDYDLDIDEASRQHARKAWSDRLHMRSPMVSAPHGNHRNAERKLRIGYVSADFRNHSAFQIFAPAILGRSKDQFGAILFANSPVNDRDTDQAIKSADEFHLIHHLNDAEADALIRRCGIDILVDLSGHSAGNRLGVFARKPAPVQVTAWGYVNGTGLPEMDYLFADRLSAPQPERILFAEKIWDLPCIVAYMPPDHSPPVAALPALANGYVTFGVFNRLPKIWSSVPLFAHVVASVPDARLVIKAIGLNDAKVQARLMAGLSAHGLDPARVTLLADSQPYDHLAAMTGIDLMLEPVAHSGGLATLESLWMGVPPLTLPGPHLSGRVAAAINAALGLEALNALSETDLMARAQEWARQPAALSQLRHGLRPLLAQSILCDQRRYAASVEAAYRGMWRRWCAVQSLNAGQR